MLFTIAAESGQAAGGPPGYFWVWPFVAILMAIAILPLMRKTHHWWEENRNKLLVALVLAAITLVYYGMRGYGIKVHGGHDEGEAHAGEVAHEHEHPTTSDGRCRARTRTRASNHNGGRR